MAPYALGGNVELARLDAASWQKKFVSHWRQRVLYDEADLTKLASAVAGVDDIIKPLLDYSTLAMDKTMLMLDSRYELMAAQAMLTVMLSLSLVMVLKHKLEFLQLKNRQLVR
jgi:hypothetical protein